MVALPAVQARSFLAGCLAALGAFAEGIRDAEEAVQIAEAVDHPYSLINAYLRLGHVYRQQGKVDKSIPAYARSRALIQDANIPVLHIDWPKTVACARWSPTATAASASYMPRATGANRLTPSYPLPSSCSAPWR